MRLDGVTERAAARLARGREAAEALMTSRVRIMRSTGRTIQDETNGREVPVWVEVATDVPFDLGTGVGGSSRTVTDGDTQYEQAAGVGKVPHAQDLRARDLLEVTSGEWAGSVYRVIDATQRDMATARRFPLEQVARPTEWEA